MSQLQTRHASGRGRGSGKKVDHKSALGDLASFDERKDLEQKLQKRMMAAPLDSHSIFEEELDEIKDMTSEEREQAAKKAAVEKAEEAAKAKKEGVPTSTMGASLIGQHIRSVVDPDPRSRLRWERKMVIRHVTRALDVKGGETKTERIKRTEREIVSKSPWIATSYKKLGYLARQIVGKTLYEAKTQMKFSQKKHAAEVLYQLDLARDTAMVERGMGLGKHNGEYDAEDAERKRIRDHRNRKWVDVKDPTRMYVDEAWVNRGPWRGKRPNYRARGRVDIIQMPQASKSMAKFHDVLRQLVRWYNKFANS